MCVGGGGNSRDKLRRFATDVFAQPSGEAPKGAAPTGSRVAPRSAKTGLAGDTVQLVQRMQRKNDTVLGSGRPSNKTVLGG